MKRQAITNFVNENGKVKVEGKYALSKEAVIEFNTITMVEASLLNRDDTNHQKTINIGGVDRMRISSQCIKRPIRKSIAGDAENTRRITYLVREKIGVDTFSEDEWDKVDAFVFGFIETKEKEDGKKASKSCKTKGAHYISNEELNAICSFICEHKDEILNDEKKKEFSKEVENFKVALVMSTPMSSEVALCGRMETSGFVHETQSALYITHQFSVDAFHNESDFFVANEDVKVMDVEDKRWGNNQESAIPGDSDINSNTLYGWAAIDVTTLISNLCVGRDISNPDVQQFVIDEAKRMVREFAFSFVNVRPAAKQVSCATFTRPELAYVTVGDKRKVSKHTYGNIYNKPVEPDYNEGVAKKAVTMLAEHISNDKFGENEYEERFWVENGEKRNFSEDLRINEDASYKLAVDKIEEIVGSIKFERVEN